MSKAILKSIRPRHVSNILNGDKIIELDKSAPKEWKDYLSGKTTEKPKPREVYIYCTKNGGMTYEYEDKKYHTTSLNSLNSFGLSKITRSSICHAKLSLSPTYLSNSSSSRQASFKKLNHLIVSVIGKLSLYIVS